MRFETKAIHAGQEPDPATGAVIPPIHPAATFAQEEPGVHRGYEYGRTQNPTRKSLETSIAALENARFGLAFASGMSAIDATLHLLQPGDHVLCSDDLYGGTYRLFERVLKPFGLEFSYIDMTQLRNVSLTTHTRLIWLETPTNPLMKVCDIAAIARMKGRAWVAVDNTFASPYLQQPLGLGADIVVHSTTKYLGGHSDVVGGALATNDEEVYERLKFLQNAVGAVPSPFDCFLVLRGIKTLAVRLKMHGENAQAIAAFLSQHPKVERIYYPGLPSHPQHELAKRQMRAFGGMLSFELRGDFRAFLRSVKAFTLAESLGGVESLICHPATMTHASIPAEERQRRGIRDSLVRLSVGIEHIDDLVEDLDQALRNA